MCANEQQAMANREPNDTAEDGVGSLSLLMHIDEDHRRAAHIRGSRLSSQPKSSVTVLSSLRQPHHRGAIRKNQRL
jgi:hypothetical protein